MESYSKNRKVKRVLAGILTIIMVFVSIDLSQFVSAQAATEYDTLYLIDNTAEKWVKNDNAKIKAIDNSNGHTAYWMTQKDETTWSVKIPKNAYNITFNRYAEDKTTQWNSWSAGGRDKNTAYYVDGSEYGHWGIRDGGEEYFHAGDIIYLDVSEFTQWEKDDAVMYVNFTNASKEENGGNDVLISSADKKMYNPKIVEKKIEEGIYQYVVEKEDEGATTLRFWRGNSTTLWNCSKKLTYEEYASGNNCVKIKGWTNEGEIYRYYLSDEKIIINIDMSICEYNDEKDYYYINNKMDILNGTISNSLFVKKLFYEVKDYKGNKIKFGNISVEDNWSTEDFGLALGVNTITVTAISIYNNVYTSEVKIINTSAENMNIEIDRNDDDNDGLINYLELICGTNPQNKDTDGDGLSDYIELMETGTDPLLKDTDKNGINDGDEDFDADGLTNIDELKYGTNLFDADSDFDTLTDGDEINIYKTNPLKKDTDSDGLTDELEILLGTNPNSVDSNSNGIEDSDEYYTFSQSYTGEVETTVGVEITLDLMGKNISTLNIEPVLDDYFLNDAIPGYIDYAYDFSVDDEFKSAIVTFSFDKKLLEDEEFVPAIFYYNEEKQLLEELEGQTIAGNTVTVKLEHFSKYLLLDKTKFDSVWDNEIKQPDDDIVYKGIDIVLALDSSGSMIDNDRNNIRKDVAKKFVNKLSDDDRAAVIDFDYTANLICGFTNDKDTLISAIDTIDSYGGTVITYAIDMAIKQFTSSTYVNNNSKKCIILLTDGGGSYDASLSTTAKNENIVIYTIGLGHYVSEDLLVKIADETGGQFYYADNASELYGIFDKVVDDADFYKDSDFDGINDYYEKKLNSGELRLGNGTTFIGLDYRNPDTDGDGLKDGQEINIYKDRDGRVYVYVNSDPLIPDGDRDGINDNDDPEPLTKLNSKYEIVSLKSHISKNSSIEELSKMADDTYNSVSVWEQVKNCLHYEWIYTRASLNVLGGPFAKFYNASKFMSNYLDNSGLLYTFSADRVLATPNGERHFCDNINELLETCEMAISNQASLCIATKDGAGLKATTYSNTGVSEDDKEGKDWWYSIGNSTAAITAKCTNDNGIYTLELYYYIQDFYDWEKNSEARGGLVNDGEMYELHEAGYAREYEVLGSYNTTIVWSKGERFSSKEDVELSSSRRRY